ncbi:hypothetical protein [Sneathiella limimaris]|uniref:hypothetical protein n=1 Tax=Sneathiella limimaris TaxID=1964213 RepID=UPI00146B5932|nr:hypothetical protein [Sneathiella limimaris]
MNRYPVLTLLLPFTLLTTACVTPSPAQDPEQEKQSLIQNVLEKNVSGQSGGLQLTNTDRVIVTPVKTWKSVTGHFCRSYITEAWNDRTLQAKTTATACRNKHGKWITVSS